MWNVSSIVSMPLSGHSLASRDISRKAKFCWNHQKFVCSPGMEAKSFKFLRKRPRAHAGKTRALPAEESLKNDWGQKREKRKKMRGKGYYPTRESSKSFVSRVISPETILKLSSNYRCYWPCFRAASSVRRAENLVRKFAPSLKCVHSHKEISILIVLFALATALCWSTTLFRFASLSGAVESIIFKKWTKSVFKKKMYVTF